MWLLRLSQYLRQRQGQEPDYSFDGLHQIYNEVKQVKLLLLSDCVLPLKPTRH